MRDKTFSPFKEWAAKLAATILKVPTFVVMTLVAFTGASAVSALTVYYLALVLPMLDEQVFYRVSIKDAPPAVGTPDLRIWFGVGALSAVTDNTPLMPQLLSAPLVDASTGALTTTANLAPMPGIEDAQITAPVRVIFGRPPIVAAARPVMPLTVPEETIAEASAPEIEETEETVLVAAVEPGLEVYAIRTSPRPDYRPAGLVPASVAVVENTARPAATAAPTATEEVTPQLASLVQPGNGGLFTGRTTGRSGSGCSGRLSRAIPRRSSRDQTGSEFIATLASASGGARDAEIAREIMSGNVPKFLRNLVPVTFTGTLGDGRRTDITICVTPDYLALGSNADYVRVPLGLSAAGQIAEHFDMMLPTTRMVDAIYTQASVRLSPQPMPPGAQMSSTPYFLRHNATVENQRLSTNGTLGLLVSGHKKDLVLTNRLASAPGRVAIYGWHRRSGSPIQPLSTVHGAGYADYSHGIRLVSQTAYVDGRAVDLQALLQDRQYARFLNSDGIVGQGAIRLAGL